MLNEPGPSSPPSIPRPGRGLVGDGARAGAWRNVGARALVCCFSAIPAVFCRLAPVRERSLGEEAVSADAVESFADAVAGRVPHALLAPGADSGDEGD